MDYTRLNPVIRSVALYDRGIKYTEPVTAYDCRIIYMFSGELQLTPEGGKKMRLAPGNFLFVPAGTPFTLRSNRFRAVVIQCDLTDGRPEPTDAAIPAVRAADFSAEECHTCDLLPFDRPLFVGDMADRRDTFTEMYHIFTSGEGSYRAEISAMLKLVLLAAAETADEHALPARMVRALDSYIRDNCAEDISNTEIGAMFGYHPFYVSRMLKDRKGVTLHQYIVSYRLRLAANMLCETEKTVNEISELCGFSDPSYFTKAFKAVYGATPKAFRDKAREEFI